MRALLQRVRGASVRVDNVMVGSCGHGLLVFLGVGPNDDEASVRKLWDKILRLRIFNDDSGKMNRSLFDVHGEVLVVSQFTLYADCARGNRPSFTGAAPARHAERLYDLFCEVAEADVAHVGRGIFGADMQVLLNNDGPVTIWLDTEDLVRKKR